jgi:nitronate monooxygenase
MFLVSGPRLVVECCKAGVVGSFPALNARPLKALDRWMMEIAAALADSQGEMPGKVAPWAVNLIVHRSNTRMRDDLEMIVRHRVPIVITALSNPAMVVDVIHDYGGLVFADVNNVEFARKAVDAGVDGLVLVCSGAGGHTGALSPFTFVPAVRRFFSGMIAVGGGITDGRGIRAVETLGADFAYLGTRFIATSESLASRRYHELLIAAETKDILTTAHFTGIPANYLRGSIVEAGVDPDALGQPNPTINTDNDEKRARAWRDIWSAGQGVFATRETLPVSALVAELKREYEAAQTTLSR